MSFDIFTVGVGNAFSTESYGTSFILQSGDFYLGIDCPDGYRKALKQHSTSPLGDDFTVDSLDAMFLTHLHGDHVNGLEMTLAYLAFGLDSRLDLYGSVDVAEQLWPKRLEASLGQIWTGESYESIGPDAFYEFHQIEWEGSQQVGPFEVQIRKTVHHIPTSALLIDDGDVCMGYSCDTEFDKSLIDWLSKADIIFHEAGLGPGHTSLEKLEGLPSDTRNKLYIIHSPDEWRRTQSNLTFADEGLLYSI
jgi:ribonuclease BN (tRNA processing enzyme)